MFEGTRPTLTSGLKGACAEVTWRVVRAFLVDARWKDREGVMTSDAAYELIAAAVIAKTYVWKTITSLKEALREGVSDKDVKFAWDMVVDAMGIWDGIVAPLLGRCLERIAVLDERVKVVWYGLQIQYSLGMLMLMDVLEVAGRLGLRGKIEKVERVAEDEAMAVLRFGLKNEMRIDGSVREDVGTSGQSMSACLIATDPYPMYTLQLVLLLRKRIGKKIRNAQVTRETYTNRMRLLGNVLDELPQSSKAVQEAKAE